jgi:predicted dehydrogenase
MRVIGFSTGAIAKSDYWAALASLRRYGVSAVELSALRFSELFPLVKALPEMDLSQFEVISFHAPSRFDSHEERSVVNELQAVARLAIPIVVHPDIMYSLALWAPFGKQLLIENMDKRKPVGRTVEELSELFVRLPEARLCFDIGHARQVDPTMAQARKILEKFSDRLAEVHLSEVNSSSRHDPLSSYAIEAFQSVAELIPERIPVILETLIDQGQSDIPTELARANQALQRKTVRVLASV